jgi:hypothetical protein
MTPMQLKTPEERKAIAKKAHATRKANKEKREAEEREARYYRADLYAEIRTLEGKIEYLNFSYKMSQISGALTNKSLLSAEEIVKHALPWEKATGVYFLVQDDEVVYVGQSVHIYSRLAQHQGKTFDRYAFVPCDAGVLDKLESLYIHVLKPKLNGNFNDQEKSAPIRFDTLLTMI